MRDIWAMYALVVIALTSSAITLILAGMGTAYPFVAGFILWGFVRWLVRNHA